MQSGVPVPTVLARLQQSIAGRRALIWFHWLTLTLVLAAVGLVLARALAADRATRLLLLDLHRQAGLLVCLLTAARLLLRFGGGHAFATQVQGMQRALATGMHALFYLLLITLPALGLAASAARGQAVRLLGLPLPAPLARDRDLAEQLLGIHEWAAWSLLALAGLHAAAALWHHWVRRDDTLRRMLSATSVG